MKENENKKIDGEIILSKQYKQANFLSFKKMTYKPLLHLSPQKKIITAPIFNDKKKKKEEINLRHRRTGGLGVVVPSYMKFCFM